MRDFINDLIRRGYPKSEIIQEVMVAYEVTYAVAYYHVNKKEKPPKKMTKEEQWHIKFNRSRLSFICKEEIIEIIKRNNLIDGVEILYGKYTDISRAKKEFKLLDIEVSNLYSWNNNGEIIIDKKEKPPKKMTKEEQEEQWKKDSAAIRSAKI